MKSKILMIALAIAVIATVFMGCTNDDKNNNTTTTNTTATTTTAATTNNNHTTAGSTKMCRPPLT